MSRLMFYRPQGCAEGCTTGGEGSGGPLLEVGLLVRVGERDVIRGPRWREVGSACELTGWRALDARRLRCWEGLAVTCGSGMANDVAREADDLGITLLGE